MKVKCKYCGKEFGAKIIWKPDFPKYPEYKFHNGYLVMSGHFTFTCEKCFKKEIKKKGVETDEKKEKRS